MNNYFENNKENKNIQWESAENRSGNWFKEKWEAVKDFLQWRKNAEVSDIREKTSTQEESLRDSAIDSRLQDLEKQQDIQDSQIDTKKELDDLLIEWMWKKDSKDVLREKELAQKLLNNDRFKNRSQDVREEIAYSADNVSQDIENYDKEQNPIARSLLWIVNKIMKTEKGE